MSEEFKVELLKLKHELVKGRPQEFELIRIDGKCYLKKVHAAKFFAAWKKNKWDTFCKAKARKKEAICNSRTFLKNVLKTESSKEQKWVGDSVLLSWDTFLQLLKEEQREDPRSPQVKFDEKRKRQGQPTENIMPLAIDFKEEGVTADELKEDYVAKSVVLQEKLDRLCSAQDEHSLAKWDLENCADSKDSKKLVELVQSSYKAVRERAEEAEVEIKGCIQALAKLELRMVDGLADLVVPFKDKNIVQKIKPEYCNPADFHRLSEDIDQAFRIAMKRLIKLDACKKVGLSVKNLKFGPVKKLEDIVRKCEDLLDGVISIKDGVRITIEVENMEQAKVILANMNSCTSTSQAKNKYIGVVKNAQEPPCLFFQMWLKKEFCKRSAKYFIDAEDPQFLVEMQITTPAMHALKEISHMIYKIMRLGVSAELPTVCTVCKV